MTTKLDKALKREIEFDGVSYTVTMSPEGLKIVEKGKRLGQQLTWQELIGGSVPLTQSLRASIAGTPAEEPEG